MKPPKQTVNTGSIHFAKMEKLTEQKRQANIYLGNIMMTGSNLISDKLKEFEELKFKIHQLCEEAWGEDPLWYHKETRFNCKYGVDINSQEFTIWNFINGENQTFDRNELEEQDFDIKGIFTCPELNRASTSVREGGYPLTENKIYNCWEWPTINWLQACLNGQLEFVDKGNAPNRLRDKDRIDVQPMMFGYSIQLDELDVVYNLTHEEVFDDYFNPEWVIDHILTAQCVPADNRGSRFEDKQFSNYVSIMLGMMTLPGQKTKIKKCGNKKCVIDPEGVTSVE